MEAINLALERATSLLSTEIKEMSRLTTMNVRICNNIDIIVGKTNESYALKLNLEDTMQLQQHLNAVSLYKATHMNEFVERVLSIDNATSEIENMLKNINDDGVKVQIIARSKMMLVRIQAKLIALRGSALANTETFRRVWEELERVAKRPLGLFNVEMDGDVIVL